MSELALLEKVELRIALANDDSQLENALRLYLAPVLLKLSSANADVRKAVLKIIQHIIPRITAARAIKLPVNALLDQAKTPKVTEGADPLSVRLYSLLFVVRGIERLNDSEKTDLIPKVIEGISHHSDPVKARLFSILCKLLIVPQIPQDLSIKEPDAQFLAETIFKFFMLLPSTSGAISASPGLTVKDIFFFNQDAGIQLNSAQEIHQIKLRLLEFLKHGFDDEMLYIPYLVASADPSSAVNEPAETLFRRLKLNIDENIINRILTMFVGSEAPPVNSVLQERILSVLLKSAKSIDFPFITKIADLGLASSNSKLKVTTVKFIQWVSKSSKDGSQKLGVDVLEQIKSDIMGFGWPKMEVSGVKNYSSSLAQRSLEYETFGNIIYSDSKLFGDELENVEFLLDSLQGEDADVRPTIQDSLSSLTGELTKINQQARDKLKMMARKYFADSPEIAHSCRYILIKFLIAVFPFDDPEARLYCIMGTSSENRLDTIEEALKGLHPYWFNLAHSATSPHFVSSHELLGKRTLSTFPSFDSIVKIIEKEGNTPALQNAMDKAIQFAVRTLIMKSVKDKSTVVVVDEEWSSRVDKAIETDEQVRELVRSQMLILSEDSNTLSLLMNIISQVFIGQFSETYPRSEIYGFSFLHLLSLSPSKIVEGLVESLPKYFDTLHLKTLTETLTVQLCQVLGIVGTHSAVSDSWVAETLNKFHNTSGVSTKISLLAISFIISRLVLRDRVEIIKTGIVNSYMDQLVGLLDSENTYYTSIQCISQLAIFGAFDPTLELVLDLTTKAKKILEILRLKVKKGDERSISALAKLGIAVPQLHESTETSLTDIESIVFDTHASKLIDVLFTSGEAFLILGAGWNSIILQQQFDIQGEELKFIETTDSRLPTIIDFILESSKSTKPSLRKACCIWLLSLVQYCKKLEAVRARAAEIHVTFMKFLVDRDDLVQELASRGLSMVYELGDHELKDTLVRGLLRSFTDSNTTGSLTAGTVDLETELFAPDVLKTDDGSVSTYKDVLSLASDVGDSSLVYKFMSLAKSSALWSSRKGMAFGLGSVLSKTSLNELLSDNREMAKKLIPRLYRYRYDPSTSVSQSMNDIWNSLIEDPSKTIKDNFDLILNELLKEIGNKEWRVRQGSVTALTDLLQTTSLDEYEDRMEEIWSMSFRAIDDIKDSVRKAGTKLTRSLATNLTRAADVSTGSSDSRATKVLGDLIPFLIGNQGLLSDAEDVRTFSLDTILKVCKVAGPRIKTFVPTLLENFISMMSTMEPDVVNYLVLNADKYNLNSNDIDAQRLQSLGRSPLMDAIEQLLGTLDEELMPKVVDVLAQTIKKSVGLPSKVCGSRVLVTLVQRHIELTKPFGDKLLQCAISQIYDRNETISSSYAAAAGYLCRISSVDEIVKFGSKISKLYFDSEDEKRRQIVALASEAVSKYSADKFDLVSGAFLPLCFIGKHDVVSKASKPFDREWIEHTSGNSAMKLYFDEILQLAEAQIGSNSYTIRRIVAQSMVELCEVVGENSTVSPNSSNHLLTILMEACRGKSWTGKDVVFDALVSTSVRLHHILQEDEMQFAALSKIVITESKRRNKEYQRKAIKLTGHFLHQFIEDDVVETYVDVMNSILWPEADDSDSDVEMDDGNKFNSRQNIKIEEEKLLFIENIFESINPERVNHDLFQLALQSVTKLFTTEVLSPTWRSKRNCNEWITSCLLSMRSSSCELNVEQARMLLLTWKVISSVCLLEGEIEAVQVQSLRCTKEVREAISQVLESQETNTIKQKLDEFKELKLTSVIQAEVDKTT